MASTYKVRCACTRTLVVGEKWFGKEIRCPHCQKTIAVPKAPGAGKPEAAQDAGAGKASPASMPPEQRTTQASGAAAPSGDASCKFKCACGRVLMAGQQFFGKKIRCPHCQRVIAVPAADAQKAPAAEGGQEVGPQAGPAAKGEAQPAQARPEAPVDVSAKPGPREQPKPDSPVAADVDGLKIEFEAPAEMAVSPEDAVGSFADIDPAALAQDEAQAGAESATSGQAEPAPSPAASEADATPEKTEAGASSATECPHCGCELTPGSVFCVNCGTDLKTGRKLRRARAEGKQAKVGYEYDPPRDGTCRLCEKAHVQVVEITSSEISKSRRFMKALRRELDTQNPSEEELAEALKAKLRDGEEAAVCEPCTKLYKIGPKKFAALVEKAGAEEEAPKEEGEAGVGKGDKGEDKPKDKPGLLGRLFGKNKAKSTAE